MRAELRSTAMVLPAAAAAAAAAVQCTSIALLSAIRTVGRQQRIGMFAKQRIAAGTEVAKIHDCLLKMCS